MTATKLTHEDIEFLQKLQHELNTQTNDGNADPVFWGIMEQKQMPAYVGCGDTYLYYDDITYYDSDLELLKETIKTTLDELMTLDEEDLETINGISSIYEAHDIMAEYDIASELGEYQLQDVLSKETGAFLTKAACQKYIDTNAHNHQKPRTYAMTAFRNFELERLLKILKTADFSKL